MKYIAILDTETTSVQPPPVGRTIEVAVMLYDLQHAQAVISFASLIKGEAKNEAESVNCIPAAMLPDAREAERVWSAVRWVIEPAEAIVAHNSDFDEQFCPDFGKPFVCSENDIQWPDRARGGNLAGLALSLGLGVASAHRAMADVDTLARILTRLAEKGADLEALVKRAMRPKVEVHSLAPYEKRDLCKQAGFRWDSPPSNPKGKKVWWRKMPLDDTKELPFKVKVIQ